MTDKSIWKKTLGWFVEIDENKQPIGDPGDLDTLLAESQQALANLKSKGADTGYQPSLGSVLGPHVSSDDVASVVEEQGESDTFSFEQLYETVCGDSPISIFQVHEFLEQPELKSLPRETKAAAVAVTLRAMGTDVKAAIQDAYMKDQALDQAELTKRRNVDRQKIENEQKIQAIKQEVDAFLKEKNAEMEALKEENLVIDRQLQSWVEAKLKQEKEIFEIVSHFVAETESPITLGKVYPAAEAPVLEQVSQLPETQGGRI